MCNCSIIYKHVCIWNAPRHPRSIISVFWFVVPPFSLAAVVAAIPVAYQVLFVWAARAVSQSKATASTFAALSWVSFFIAIGYAVNWGTAEGGRVQSTDQVRPSFTVCNCTINFTRAHAMVL